MEIIDSYLHCGLSKYRPVEDVEATMVAAGVSRAVMVQHLGEYDNGYIGGLVEARPDRFAGVCLVDHQDAGAGRHLEALIADGPFRGVRLTSEVLRVAPEVFGAAAEAGAVIVFYAPEGISGSVDALGDFLQSYPACRLVVTHLGNPRAEDSPEFPGHSGLFRLGDYGGVYLQLSGMEMFCPYPHEPLYPLIEAAAGSFGPERLLWGSNYPVVGGVDDYRRELDLLLVGRLPLPAQAIPAVAGGNGRELWFGG